MTTDLCHWCHGTGRNEHGNTCEFCDGHGWIDMPEDERWPDESDDDGQLSSDRRLAEQARGEVSTAPGEVP